MNTVRFRVNQRFMNRRPPTSAYATINKSLVNQLSHSDIYRFFCLSLSRNGYYNVRMRLQDIAKKSRESVKSLKNFNKHISHIVSIKSYYIPYKGNPMFEYIRRNIYRIPDIEEKFITLSKNFTRLDMGVKVKGYYIKLLLIAANNIINLTTKKIAKLLRMDDDTVLSYNIELLKNDLLEIQSDKLVLTPGELLLSNDIAIPRMEWKVPDPDSLPKITINGKNTEKRGKDTSY